MHRAPAASLKVGRSRWHLYAIGCMATLCLVCTVILSLQQALPSAEVAALSGVCLVCVLLAGRGWYHVATGLLRWDGQRWHWSGFADDAACTVRLHLDFQSWILLSAHEDGARKVWLWLEAAGQGPSWMAIRRAIVQSQRITDTVDQ